MDVSRGSSSHLGVCLLIGMVCTGPGHFYEVSKILPLLTEPGDDSPAFHVVAPSLPNFGFSEAICQPDFGLKEYAQTCHQIMQALGYTRYAAQGGDWVR
jgi:pimeloyl-ACP methyl ester carboxylesterase